MNHREIEYEANKIWQSIHMDIAQIPQMFAELYKRQADADKENTPCVQSLMQWLEQRGHEVFQEDLLLDYGIDCLRCYLMFEKTPLAGDKMLDSWEECSLEGIYKFLVKYRRLILIAREANQKGIYDGKDFTAQLQYIDSLFQTCLDYMGKKNTMPNRHNVISTLMKGQKYLQTHLHISEIVMQENAHEIERAVPHTVRNTVDKVANCSSPQGREPGFETTLDSDRQNPQVHCLCQRWIVLMAPFAPYLSEALWQSLGEKDSVLEQKWSIPDSLVQQELICIPVQINAKTKKILQVEKGLDSREMEQRARAALSSVFNGASKQYRVIHIPDKIINFVEQE